MRKGSDFQASGSGSFCFMHQDIPHFYTFYTLGPIGTDSAVFAMVLALCGSFSSHKGLRRSFAPRAPKARSVVTNTAFTPMSTAGDAHGTTHAYIGVCGVRAAQRPTAKPVLSSFIPSNVLVPI